MNNRSEKVINTWKIIHNHYTNIKTKYNLTSSDILKQLNCQPCLKYLQYLSENEINYIPATRKKTVGRKLYDVLIPGMKKID